MDDDRGPLRFAMVTDTHASASRAAATEQLSRVYAAIARLAPDFVLHCGDITDTGLPGEYELYLQLVPAGLRGLIRHVPGNHDVRWDRTAKGMYRAHFGPAPYSFDAAGVHFIGFDPTQALLESGHCGKGGLRWLQRDLRRLPAGRPSLLFQHFPVGPDHRYRDHGYVDDETALLELVAGYDVRGVFAGHVHAETVAWIDGMIQITLQAVLAAPVYYWAEKTAGEDGPVLTICRVTVAADGTQARLPVAVVPLSGDDRAPARRIITGAGSGPRADIQRTDIPRADIPRAVPGGTTGPRQRWKIRLAGSVQGGIATCGATVAVAASTGGEVAAFGVAAGPGVRELWRARLGPVYRRPGVDAAASMLFVPSADHHLYALDARTGLVRWRFDAGSPVLSGPALAPAGQDEYVVFSAGQQLFAVDAATGQLAWSVPGRGFSCGRAACDGQRVYTSAADGYARAHDVRTGRETWSHPMVSGDEHRMALYSGWDNVVALGAGAVIVATVSGSRALEASTGTLRWTLPQGAMYPPAVVLATDPGTRGTALFTTEQGVVSRVDLTDGGIAWQVSLGIRVQNAGLAVAGDSAWVVSEHGRLIRVRIADGQEQGSVRHALACCYSAPAIVGDTLITGDQDGFVHGIRLSSLA